ncbi:glycosyltransferase family 9 protein [Xanthobacter sp. KR7-65]|uniref:glycosyltransferase family 9 protein n=1 Tax=Xanthobacter sp. KR7-65 TaxID=3156612 RepID=UPI0032B44233
MARITDLWRGWRGRSRTLVPAGSTATASDPASVASAEEPASCATSGEGGVSPPMHATFAPGLWRGPVSRLAALGRSPSLLVVKLDHVGDLVTALPACERLRRAFPQSRMDLLCAPFTRDLARATGLFDTVHAFPYYPARDHPPERATAAALEALRALRLPPADIAIDLRHHDDARALLAALPVRFRAGFAGLSTRHALDLALPEMEASVRAGGRCDPLPAGVRLSLLAEALAAMFAAAQEEDAALVRAARQGREDLPGLPGGDAGYVVLAPGARLAIKGWPLEHWRALAAALLARGTGGLVIVGSAEERGLCAALAEDLDANRVAELSGRLDLPQLTAVIASAQALVGLDSAPAHIAARLGRPTAVLFSGLADMASWAPTGPRVAVASAFASCAPCFLPDLSQCPHDHGCMRTLTGDHALAALASAGLEFAGVPSH